MLIFRHYAAAIIIDISYAYFSLIFRCFMLPFYARCRFRSAIFHAIFCHDAYDIFIMLTPPHFSFAAAIAAMMRRCHAILLPGATLPRLPLLTPPSLCDDYCHYFSPPITLFFAAMILPLMPFSFSMPLTP